MIKNVDIINYSGGGPQPSKKELAILKKAEAKGILIVAAAGNEASNIDNKKTAYYPASYNLSNIITVMGHNKEVKKVNSSNWGTRHVDISAPGMYIKSALPHGKYGHLTGTSQATAFVSGVAGLLLAQHPELSYHELKKIIVDSAKKEKNLRGKCASQGRIDAGNALKMAGRYTKRSKPVLAYKKSKEEKAL